MLAKFKKAILVSVFASTVAVCAAGSLGAVGIAQAAPDFQNAFDGPYKPLLLANTAATPASGIVGITTKSKPYAIEDVSEFTDTYQSKMPEALAAIDHEAPPAVRNPTLPVPRVISTPANQNTLGDFLPPPVMAMANSYHVKMQSAAACRAFDAKLDKRRIPSFKGHAILAHHGCGIRSTGSIES